MTRLCFAPLLVVAFVMGADKAEPDPKPVKPPKADVRGEVKTVTALRGSLRLLIEGKKEADTKEDKAFVSVTPATKVEKWVGGKKVKAKVTDLSKGCIVQSVFTGPVRDSYPVQATAAELLILKMPKK